MYNLSVILPTYNREKLLRRAIQSIEEQETNLTAEIFVYGDNCPILDSLKFNVRSNRLKWHIENLPAPNNGNPARAINKAIELSNSEVTLFLGDDDYIRPKHFETYYHGVIDNKVDMAYFNSYVYLSEKDWFIRNSEPAWGKIGHSEIAILTSLLKDAPKHVPDYGHDWLLIQWLLNFNTMKVESEPTYVVNWSQRPKNYVG